MRVSSRGANLGVRAVQRLLSTSSRGIPKDGKTLKDFVESSDDRPANVDASPAFDFNFGIPAERETRTFHIETMGCQMNVSDSEIVRSVLEKSGMSAAKDLYHADVILVNTCSIRDNAERKVWDRLAFYNSIKKKRRAYHSHLLKAGAPPTQPLDPQQAKLFAGGLATEPADTPEDAVVGILGCMAERLKSDLLEAEKGVDLVAGPDAYRDLPNLLARAGRDPGPGGQAAVNVVLSTDETYADIAPVRAGGNGTSAFVSIMRGCNNMCSYCIVPFTRGRERSREAASIVEEVRALSEAGYKEVTLLGQNVNSYNYLVGKRQYAANRDAKSQNFQNIAKPLIASSDSVDFTGLVDSVSMVDPELRVRFTSPHPKDFPDDLIELVADRPNVCSSVHLPAQSGSSAVLARMRRGYTREAYLDLVGRMRDRIPGLTLSTDVIAGFCGETESEHRETVELMEAVCYDFAYMFKYSTREGTHAHRKLADDVPEGVKARRLREIIDTFYANSERKNQTEIGKIRLVLVEGRSKKSAAELVGRSCANKKIIFPATELQSTAGAEQRVPVPGDYVAVEVVTGSAQSLRGTALHLDTLQAFYARGEERAVWVAAEAGA